MRQHALAIRVALSRTSWLAGIILALAGFAPVAYAGASGLGGPRDIPEMEPPAAPHALSGCVPPDGRWRIYPTGLHGYHGFFDLERNRFIIPLSGESELEVLTFPPEPAGWSRVCAEGQAPSTILVKALDLEHDRVLVVGEAPLAPGAPASAGVWELSLAPRLAWRRLDPGLPPVVSAYALDSYAVVDAGRNRLLIILNYYPHRHVWAIDLVNWEFVPVTHPNINPRWYWREPVVLDPIGDRLLSFGGSWTEFSGHPVVGYTNEVFFLPLSDPNPQWTALPIVGAAPHGRQDAAIAFDSKNHRLLMAAGQTFATVHRDVWELPLSGTRTWRQLSGGQTPTRAFFNRPMGYDEALDRVLLYSYHPDDDLWALSVSTLDWELVAGRARPIHAGGRASVFDSRRHRILQQRGGDFTPDGFASWVSVSRAGVVESGVLPTGPRLSGRAAVYDSHDDRFLVFSGRNALDQPPETWQLSLQDPTAWSVLPVAGEQPPSLANAHSVYDRARRRVVLHADEGPVAETWILALHPTRGWTRLDPAGSPPRGARLAVHDTDRHRLLLVGPDLWELPLGDQLVWRRLDVTNGGPGLGPSDAAVFDEARGTVVVRSGQGTFELSLDGTPSWRPIHPLGVDPGSGVFPMLHDPSTSLNLLAWGNQVWELDRGQPVRAEFDARPGNPNDHRSAKSRAPIRIDLYGSALLAVSDVEISSVRLAGVPVIVDGGAPTKSRVRDFDRDGHLDLELVFDAAVAEVVDRGPLVLRGLLGDGRLFRGEAELSLRRRANAGSSAMQAEVPSVGSPKVQAAFKANRLIVGLEEARPGMWQVECFDVTGRRLASRAAWKPASTRLELEFPESDDWKAGLMFVRARNATHQWTLKVVRL